MIVVVSWLAVRALLRAGLDPELHGRVDVLWTLNPLVIGIGVLGAHIDTVATALALAAVVVAARRPGWSGALLGGAWWPWRARRSSPTPSSASGCRRLVAGRSRTARALARLVGALVGGFVVVAGRPAPVGRPARLRPAAALPPGRVAGDAVAAAARVGPRHLGQRPDPPLISVAAALLAVVLAWCLLRA